MQSVVDINQKTSSDKMFEAGGYTNASPCFWRALINTRRPAFRDKPHRHRKFRNISDAPYVHAAEASPVSSDFEAFIVSRIANSWELWSRLRMAFQTATPGCTLLTFPWNRRKTLSVPHYNACSRSLWRTYQAELAPYYDKLISHHSEHRNVCLARSRQKSDRKTRTGKEQTCHIKPTNRVFLLMTQKGTC